MEKKELPSSKAIKDYIAFCEQEYERISSEIDAIPTKLFGHRRKESKIQKKELKTQLRGLRKNISDWLFILEDCVTFERYQFLSFLTKYLSIVEKEQYISMKGVQEESAFIPTYRYYLFDLFNDKYDIITTLDNYDKLSNQDRSFCGTADTDDIETYLEACENKRFICLEVEDKYTLLDGTSLAEEFREYPYLYDLAYEIIDLKLSNPSLSNDEIFNMILSKESRPYKKPKKHKYRSRKFYRVK